MKLEDWNLQFVLIMTVIFALGLIWVARTLVTWLVGALTQESQPSKTKRSIKKKGKRKTRGSSQQKHETAELVKNSKTIGGATDNRVAVNFTLSDKFPVKEAEVDPLEVDTEESPDDTALPTSVANGLRISAQSRRLMHRRSISAGLTGEGRARLEKLLNTLPLCKEIGNKRIELLVHNVSHKDMILSVAHPSKSENPEDDLILCRPKFSLFQLTSMKIFKRLNQSPQPPVVNFPVYTRQENQTLRRAANEATPVGFGLSDPPIFVDTLANYRMRRDDAQKLHPNEPVCLSGVYFPLLATIIPKWIEDIRKKDQASDTDSDEEVFKIVFLVSGVGIPRDNRQSAEGNSTQGTAFLIDHFIQRNFPDIHVVNVHSTTNLFRYDQNISFVKQELLPLIEVYRNMSAEKHHAEWRHMYNITISFADGCPARISAINASLRPYRPSFMHMWELKTFWHETKVCMDDCEVHSFEHIDTTPPIPINYADRLTAMAVEHMRAYKQEILKTGSACEELGDLGDFWLRKTKKPVLAILIVEKQGQPPIAYRGCNMEVSMPTGSLCAERNAIGSALAADLTLKREDLKVISVYSVCFPGCGGSCESPRVSSPVSNPTTPAQRSPLRQTTIQPYSLNGTEDVKTILVEPTDLNPLKPCGACNEWLKKIAEVNPKFRVVTFTDKELQGIYIESISTS